MIPFAPFVIALLAAAPAPPDSAPDARPLVERVTATYRALKSHHFEGMVHLDMKTPQGPRTIEMPIRMAAVKPGRSRIEMHNPMMALIRVSNGDTTWTCVPQLGQYTRQVSAPAPAPDSAADAFASGTPLARYVALDRGLVRSRVVGQSTVEIGGRAVPCHRVEVEYAPGPQGEASPTTYWIDSARSIVLRESVDVRFPAETGDRMEMRQITSFTVARVNEPLPDTLFSFRPPEGTVEVARIEIPGMQPSDPSGQAAPDFDLVDLAGRRASLAAHKGKVVLLDFWASWCGPCRIEMPTIGKLDRELRDRGLVVLGINVGESAATARAFVKKNRHAFRVLLDEKGIVADRFGAVGLPTVVIVDREGKISSHFVGLRTEADLRAALKRAGIE